MPKTKKQASSSESDSGPEDRNPPAKKSKSGSTKSSKGTSDGEEDSWPIGKSRFVKVREFKGNYYVDIREFYDAGGELKPGKKGISLSMDQWQKFKDVIDDVDATIKRLV